MLCSFKLLANENLKKHLYFTINGDLLMAFFPVNLLTCIRRQEGIGVLKLHHAYFMQLHSNMRIKVLLQPVGSKNKLNT